MSFKDIAFLEINQELASILKLSELGNTDWKAIFDNFSEIGTNFSKENLKDDIDNLYAMGVSLASAGANNLVNSIIGNSSFNGTIIDKANSVIDIADNIYDLYNGLSNDVDNIVSKTVFLSTGPD